MVYSENPEEHTTHIQLVLELLQRAGLQVKPQKCEFDKTTTEYLSVIITPNGLQLDPKKVSAVMDWPVLQKLRDVRQFVGFGNYDRRFIKDFSHIVKPLTLLTKKEQRFECGEPQQQACETLKSTFTTAPVLHHFDPAREITLETDASNLVSAGILSQPDDEGILHPVAFYSKKHSPVECGYPIYDKELLAIVMAFKHWRPLLEGSTYPILVVTDHRNLLYFMTNRLLNYHQTE